MSNLILIGMMGSGKSTIGRVLADRTGMKFLDTDKMIEDTQGFSISKIFELYGESRFRELESSLLKKLSELENTVISTGGGIILNPSSSLIMREMGSIVYLRGSVEQLKQNLGEDDGNRPLLKNNSIETILKVRAGLYENTASHIVDIDGKSVDEIVDEIMRIALITHFC